MTRKAYTPKTDEERAAEVAALSARLETAVSDLASDETWRAMIRMTAMFHSYSFGNIMLLQSQALERGMTLTRVAGFNTWRKLGRAPRKGEKSLKVWAPNTYVVKDKDTGAELVDEHGRKVRRVGGFRVASVFDYSQTDGDPLPSIGHDGTLVEGDAPDELIAGLETLIAREGFRVEYATPSGQAAGAEGATWYAKRLVQVKPDVGSAARARILAHELGHILADHEHRDVHGAQGETEAESIGCVVMEARGVSTEGSAAPYVLGWSKGDVAVIRAAAETVHTVSVAILTSLAELAQVEGAA